MKLKLSLMLAICLIALAPQYSFADEKDSEASDNLLFIGPQLGVFNAIDADDPSFMGGAAVRLKLGFIGIEGTINYREESYFKNSVTVKNWPIMVTGLIYPFPVVYGAIGAGWYNTNYTYNSTLIGLEISSETKQLFGWHFGGGVEVPIGTTGILTGDLRYVFLDYDFKEFPGNSGAKADYVVFMVGFLFRI